MKIFLCTFAIASVLAPAVVSARPGQEIKAEDHLAQADGGRPQAKTEQERREYLADSGKTDGPALESAANDFAARYPASELRVYLYAQAMHAFQSENNGSEVLAMAHKVLALNPNHCVALVLSAMVLADSLEAGDHDRGKKTDEIKRTAYRGIRAARTNYIPPVSATPEQAAVYRYSLQSMGYWALGMMKLKTGDDAGAEKDLVTALALSKLEPNAYIWYDLSLAQDHRRRYSSALNSVEQALQLASSSPDLQKLAEIEHDRLEGLAGRAPRSRTSAGAGPRQ